MPEIDSDLEEECHPNGLKDSNIKTILKQGNEFDIEEIGEGDEATAGLSGVINHAVPDHYRPSKSDGAAPEA